MRLLFILLISSCCFFFQCTPQIETPSSKTDQNNTDTLGIVKKQLLLNYPNHSILTLKKGDLNLDLKTDIIAVLETSCDTTFGENLGSNGRCRLTLLMVQKEYPSFQIAAANKFIIECLDSPSGSTYKGEKDILIDNGYLTFSSRYARTYLDISFRYHPDKDNWFLMSKTFDYVNGENSNFSSVDYQEKQIDFNAYHLSM